jgi:hypothetical protein
MQKLKNIKHSLYNQCRLVRRCPFPPSTSGAAAKYLTKAQFHLINYDRQTTFKIDLLKQK